MPMERPRNLRTTGLDFPQDTILSCTSISPRPFDFALMRRSDDSKKEDPMAKKALCVGINDYPGEGSDLNGCVNDAKAWANLLIKTYSFPSGSVKLLLDAQATKDGIMTGLKKLLAGAKSGDVLVFTNSSHGTYVTDTSSDEPLYDEALCPFDCDRNLIVDDELRELFSGLPKGVALTVISDSCHSGTVTRAAINENIPWLKTPDDRRVRFLHPSLIGKSMLSNPFQAVDRSKAKHPQSKMKEVLLSGCTASEYSYDALIGGKYHGAMTYFAIQAIRETGDTITYAQLRSRLLHLLDQAGYPQHPQLEGTAANKKKPIFT
jgi:hypothetical protein